MLYTVTPDKVSWLCSLLQTVETPNRYFYLQNTKHLYPIDTKFDNFRSFTVPGGLWGQHNGYVWMLASRPPLPHIVSKHLLPLLPHLIALQKVQKSQFYPHNGHFRSQGVTGGDWNCVPQLVSMSTTKSYLTFPGWDRPFGLKKWHFRSHSG